MKTLLKSGKIVDGSGSEPYCADILIEDDRIRRIGGNLSDETDRVIDCSGLVVTPGFIDIHSHNDCFIARQNNDRFFVPFLEQGITTQVTGNCGFSPFGYDKDTEYRELIGSGLFDLSEIKGDTSTLPGFAAAIKNMPLNVVPLYGHMSARIGIAGYDSRELTDEELVKTEEILEQALKDGAAGISFGLMYEPDRYAPYEELRRAAAICARHGKILTIHGRANSAASTSYNPPVGGRAHNLRALDEMERLARDTGVKIQHSHLIFVGEKSWKTVDEALAIVKRMNDEGFDFKYDSYSLTYGASIITVVLPGWFLSLPAEKRSGKLAMLRLAIEIGVTKRVLGFNFNDIVVTWIAEGQDELIGKTVAQIAKDWGVSELRAYIRLVELSEGRGRVLMQRYLTDEIVLRLMKDENCYFMTDAWIEEEGKQNPSCYLCFPLFLKIARENGLALKDMIHRMTGMAAERYRIAERGLLKEGFFADIAVFDEKAIGPGATDESRPEGVSFVLVNGTVVVDNGAFSGKNNEGRLLLQKEQ
ncbi:MAG: amidohydrolase family protein [Oscillospiraceae bacterium]|nr:amidohydrolase family protein [Oscillospiraceae bacterium]